MAIILILGDGGPPSPPARAQGTPVLYQLRVGGRRSVPALYRVRTAALTQRTGLTYRLRTAAPVVPPAIPLPPPPDGDVVHAPPIAYLVSHGGLPQQAVSYTLGNARADGEGKDRPTATVELLGQVDPPSGDLYVTVTAQGLTGQGGFAQVYGPFRVVASSQAQTPTGWTTTLSTADTTAADTDGQPGFVDLEHEYLPWERERDLTPLQQAQKARRDAEKQRALKDVPCPVKDAPDRRSVPVQTLIWALIGVVRQTLPVVVTAPLPFRGDRFWASDDTGVPFHGGLLIGTSYQVKGRPPIASLRDLLGRAGWLVKVRDGQVIIGPPAPQSSGAAQTAGSVEVPAELLTEVRIEWVNAAPGQGNLTTPRRVTFEGAAARKYLPPLPEQTPEETFETARNMTLTGEGRTYVERTSGTNQAALDTVLESRTTWSKAKTDGLLRVESRQTDGLVQYKTPTWFAGSDSTEAVTLEFWAAPRETRETTYAYGDPLWPQEVTRQTETVGSRFERPTADGGTQSVFIAGAGRTTITQSWHEKGWLSHKTTVKDNITEWHTYTVTTDSSSTTYTVPARTREVETETWAPTRPGWWKHRIERTTDTWMPSMDEGEVSGMVRRRKTEVLTDDETDQGPPMAKRPDCTPDQPEGFPYDERLKVSWATNGRADGVTLDIPWATSIPQTYLDDYLAANAQRPAKRTTYSMPVPPAVKVGDVVRSFSVQGQAGQVRATVTVEEEVPT